MIYQTKTLEFDKILKLVSKHAVSPRVRETILDLQIYNNPDVIKVLLHEVDDALGALNRASNINLDSKYDIDEQLKRLEIGSILQPNELVLIHTFLKEETRLKSYNQNLKKLKVEAKYLESYFFDINLHDDLLKLLGQTIDPDANIYDNASNNLFKIRRTLQSKLTSVNEKMEKLMNKYSDFLNERVIVTRNDRYCLCINQSFKNKIKGVVHDISSSGQTVYLEPEEIRSITSEIEFLKVEERKEILKILADVSNKLAINLETLKINLEIFLTLDLIYAKANYAKEINGVIPKINQNGLINLIKARHPLIEPKVIVPINFYLDEKAPTMIITGPNTGGKTVALKTVGLLTLMAQSGLLIPASEKSEVAVFSNIYADIGDEQSLEQSLSTFSSHMTKIKKIVDNVTPNDLILIDELGSGTDPVEGTSLAISILDYLRKHKPRLVITTHYSELKVYAFESSDIVTASVAFDTVTLEPKYHLQIGTTGSSNAILIANRLGLNKEIIENAKLRVSGHQSDIAKIIENLAVKEQKLEDKKKYFEESQLALDEKMKQYDNLLLKNHQEQDRIIKEIRDNETKIWNEKHLEVQKLIKELKAKKELSAKEEAEVKKIINKPREKTIVKTDYNFKVGDYVSIQSYGQSGYIKEIDGDDYYIDLGPFTLNFKKSDLLLAPVPKPEKKINRRKTVNREGEVPTKEASVELDLRGVRYEEVYGLLDKAIDNLLLSNLKSLRIIHGYGTGAVKKAVSEYIKSSNLIKSHRSGGENEGMLGVTIITLK
ncbi:MAG TPA: endonuclease MutS2 [Acholeplasmataceae bacterium]|jgi:DNA mismatch repair protein MutS2|nr:endonuclease MutS2 [Acholeplasmataceae bacterium]